MLRKFKMHKNQVVLVLYNFKIQENEAGCDKKEDNKGISGINKTNKNII